MNLSLFLWSVADLLRGKYKQQEYGKIILSFILLHCMDWVLAPIKDAILAEAPRHGLHVLAKQP